MRHHRRGVARPRNRVARHDDAELRRRLAAIGREFPDRVDHRAVPVRVISAASSRTCSTRQRNNLNAYRSAFVDTIAT
jgi:hypothetical protein